MEREELIEKLERQGYIRSKKVKDAMLKTPRELFVGDKKRYAYTDSPLDIGFGQTISAPHMVAVMVEELEVDETHVVLEIGTGSGYHAAVVANIVKEVYSIERIPELAEFARNNLKKAGYEKKVKVFVGDGTLGLPNYAPFDRIYITAATPEIPEPLIKQLKDDGILIAPVGKGVQTLVKLRKRGKKIEIENLMGCVFVPLVGRYGF